MAAVQDKSCHSPTPSLCVLKLLVHPSGGCRVNEWSIGNFVGFPVLNLSSSICCAEFDNKKLSKRRQNLFLLGRFESAVNVQWHPDLGVCRPTG